MLDKTKGVPNIMDIKKEIISLVASKNGASRNLYNDRLMDFYDEVDEKILKLRRIVMDDLFENPNQLLNKYQMTCFKELEGYLLEEFIKNKDYSIDTFNNMISNIEGEYNDNAITLWYSAKPISIIEWLERFKRSSKVKQYKWEPKFTKSVKFDNKMIIINSKLNELNIYWYIDNDYDFSHLIIIDGEQIKVLNKEEYLKLDIFSEIILSVFNQTTEFIKVK